MCGSSQLGRDPGGGGGSHAFQATGKVGGEAAPDNRAEFSGGHDARFKSSGQAVEARPPVNRAEIPGGSLGHVHSEVRVERGAMLKRSPGFPRRGLWVSVSGRRSVP